MSTVEDLKKKVEELQEQNNAQHLLIKKQEFEIKRLYRSNHEVEMCRLPVLHRRLDTLQNYSRQLERELDEERRQANVFQQEVFTLRSLVEFAHHPELVDAARAEGRSSMLEKELKSIHRQLNDARTLCEAYQHRCGKACEVAERVQQELYQTQEDKRVLEDYFTQQLNRFGTSMKEIKESIGENYAKKLPMFENRTGSNVGITGGRTQTFDACNEIELDISISSGTEGVPPDTGDEPSIRILSADSHFVALSNGKVNQLEQLPNHAYENELAPQGTIDVCQKGQMLNKASSSELKKRDGCFLNFDSTLDEDARKWKRALGILKGENHLLICRVNELVEKNKTYIRNIAYLEKQVSMLNHKLRIGGSIESDVSSSLA
ncbi:unnamed protein product [Phytomonas sp. EM1]|nr:unnamed protein product [Phytomonas sp. EM1]|eukprot:CCW61421.1 unnamed protein product [Phytomonas sp. isolate EM1]